MADNPEPDFRPRTLKDLLAHWRRAEDRDAEPWPPWRLSVAWLTLPVPGKRYLVDANRGSAYGDGSQTLKPIFDRKRPALQVKVYWSVRLRGSGTAEIEVEFMPALDAPAGLVSTSSVPVGLVPPQAVLAGWVKTPFDPVRRGSNLTFVLRDPPPGFVVEQLQIYSGGYKF